MLASAARRKPLFCFLAKRIFRFNLFVRWDWNSHQVATKNCGASPGRQRERKLEDAAAGMGPWNGSAARDSQSHAALLHLARRTSGNLGRPTPFTFGVGRFGHVIGGRAGPLPTLIGRQNGRTEEGSSPEERAAEKWGPSLDALAAALRATYARQMRIEAQALTVGGLPAANRRLGQIQSFHSRNESV